MIVSKQANAEMGIVVEGFEAATATDAEVADLKRHVYTDKIAVLKGQDLSAAAFVELGKRFGEPVAYYEPCTITRTLILSSCPPMSPRVVGRSACRRRGSSGMPTISLWISHSDSR